MNNYYIPDSGYGKDLGYYGGYRTRTFADIFPDVETWFAYEENCPIAIDLEAAGMLTNEQLYYLLYARYGNRHIAMDDENRFIYALWSIIFQYGPTVSRNYQIQISLRDLTKEQLILGSKAIYNHSFNPSTAPSTSTLEELTTINAQNTTQYKRSELEAYAQLMALLENDVLEEFLNKFNRLFIKVIAPDYPLLYETNPEDYII